MAWSSKPCAQSPASSTEAIVFGVTSLGGAPGRGKLSTIVRECEVICKKNELPNKYPAWILGWVSLACQLEKENYFVTGKLFFTSLISPATFLFHFADNFIHIYEEQFQTPLLFQALTFS